jgi:hypothetical protein
MTRADTCYGGSRSAFGVMCPNSPRDDLRLPGRVEYPAGDRLASGWLPGLGVGGRARPSRCRGARRVAGSGTEIARAAAFRSSGTTTHAWVAAPPPHPAGERSIVFLTPRSRATRYVVRRPDRVAPPRRSRDMGTARIAQPTAPFGRLVSGDQREVSETTDGLRKGTPVGLTRSRATQVSWRRSNGRR